MKYSKYLPTRGPYSLSVFLGANKTEEYADAQMKLTDEIYGLSEWYNKANLGNKSDNKLAHKPKSTI